MINYSSIKFISALLIVFIHTSSLYADQNINIEDEVREISGLLMCPVCQGQSVSESNSQLAEDMRNSIRSQLKEGKSREEILSYFKSRYGDSILASPPPKGINWIIWILPTAGVLLIGFILGNYIYKSQKTEDKEFTDSDTPKDNTIKKIEDELKNLNP